MRILRLANPWCDIRYLPIDAVSIPLWSENRRAVTIAASMEAAIEGSRTYQEVRRAIDDDALVRYFQAAIVRRLVNWSLFPIVAAGVSTRCRVEAIREWDTEASGAEPATSLARAAMRAEGAAAALFLAAVPAMFAVRQLRHGIRWTSAPRRTLSLPVVWGLSDAKETGGTLRPHHDDYLYGEYFKPGDIVHLAGGGMFPRGKLPALRQEVARRGYAFADADRLGLDLRMLRLLARVQLAALAGMRVWIRGSALDVLLLRESGKALYSYLRRHAELLAAPVDVAVIRDDYNPGHVVGTIAARERGTATFGIHHVAQPCDAPQIAFTHLDAHGVFAPLFADAFAPTWRPGMAVPVGRESIDWLMEAGTPDRLADASRRWQAKYGLPPRLLALVLLPGGAEICLPRQWEALAEGLRQFAAASPHGSVVLRFRNDSSLRTAVAGPLRRLAESDSRFIIEQADFTTYELMWLSTVVIAPGASFTVNEALAAGKPVFTFDFTATAALYFDTFGDDFILRDPGDLARVLGAMPDGYDAFRVNWDHARAAANYHVDGQNCRRLQAAVAALVSRTRNSKALAHA